MAVEGVARDCGGSECWYASQGFISCYTARHYECVLRYADRESRRTWVCGCGREKSAAYSVTDVFCEHEGEPVPMTVKQERRDGEAEA